MRSKDATNPGYALGVEILTMVVGSVLGRGFSLSFNRSERGRVVRRETAPSDCQELLLFRSIIIRFRFSSVFFFFLSFMEILDSQIYKFDIFLMFFIAVIITF